MTFLPLLRIIQGGMGAGVSSWSAGTGAARVRFDMEGDASDSTEYLAKMRDIGLQPDRRFTAGDVIAYLNA
ncbi:MAG: hypothetical protein ABI442_21695 [Gemmatimonadaceae bacterium]